MKDFQEFVSRWCQHYRYMQHVPGKGSKNQRFFLVDGYMSMVNFMTKLPVNASPCVAMETNQEGSVRRGIMRPEYTLYFLVKSKSATDGEQNSEAKKEAMRHFLKFYAYLQREADKIDESVLFDFENIFYQTVGPLYNGWYAVTFTITRTDQFNICVDPLDYVDNE